MRHRTFSSLTCKLDPHLRSHNRHTRMRHGSFHDLIAVSDAYIRAHIVTRCRNANLSEHSSAHCPFIQPCTCKVKITQNVRGPPSHDDETSSTLRKRIINIKMQARPVALPSSSVVHSPSSQPVAADPSHPRDQPTAA